MSISKDWITRTAEDIPDMPDAPLIIEKIRAAIIKHCPFKVGVAYMPVPKCGSCRHFGQPLSEMSNVGTCVILSKMTEKWEHVAIVPKDFGCVQWEAK